MSTTFDDAVEILSGGGVGVLPTDTLYGLVGYALDPDVVARIYDLKERDPDKPLIVLISDVEQVEEFGVVVSLQMEEVFSRYWPGPVSIILETVDEQFSYLDRGTGRIAFRLPADEQLRDLIRNTGPLVAPSANPQGSPPATNTEEARTYFGTSIDFYVDVGEKKGGPSKVIEFTDGEVNVVRD